jgi:hypothetical protein
MLRMLPAVIAATALIACGVVHGIWTDRWQKSDAVSVAAVQLEQVAALELPGWKAERLDVQPSQEVAGALQMRYTHGQTSVVIALVCGRHGPVSIHTPEACYAAAGYEVGPPSRVSTAGGKATMWSAEAIKKTATNETRLRLYWGWNAGKGWTASDDPRVEFARYPVLHKLYVLRELSGPSEPAAKVDPCLGFMDEFMPKLERALFGPAS